LLLLQFPLSLGLDVQIVTEFLSKAVLLGLHVIVVLLLSYDAVMIVLQLGSLILSIFVDLLFISLEREFHGLGVVEVISPPPDSVLLVPNDLREGGGHDPGFGLVVVLVVHGLQALAFLVFLLLLKSLHLFLLDLHLNLVHQGLLLPLLLLLLALLRVLLVVLQQLSLHLLSDLLSLLLDRVSVVEREVNFNLCIFLRQEPCFPLILLAH
jgi:hypothetical protein